MTTAAVGPGVPGTVLHDGSLTLGGITLGLVDAAGVEWVLSSLEGWAGTDSTGSVEQRAGGHGGWVDRAWRAPRVVNLTGALTAGDYVAASVAVDELLAAVPLDIPAPMVVDEGGGRVLTANVRQAEVPLVEQGAEPGGVGWARFSLSLLAPDPRRYAVEVTTATTGLPSASGGLSLPLVMPLSIGATVTSGVASVVNAGNMDTPPTFTLAGPVPAGASITHVESGRRLFVPDAVPAGRSLTLDADARTALLDGTASRVVTGSWFDLPPGPSEVAFSAPSYDAAASLSVSFRSAWR